MEHELEGDDKKRFEEIRQKRLKGEFPRLERQTADKVEKPDESSAIEEQGEPVEQVQLEKPDDPECSVEQIQPDRPRKFKRVDQQPIEFDFPYKHKTKIGDKFRTFFVGEGGGCESLLMYHKNGIGQFVSKPFEDSKECFEWLKKCRAQHRGRNLYLYVRTVKRVR